MLNSTNHIILSHKSVLKAIVNMALSKSVLYQLIIHSSQHAIHPGCIA
jgi:hypothetical protein